VVDAIERLPAGVAVARVRVLREVRQRPRLVQARSGPSFRVRVCGAPGIALVRVVQRTSPTGRNAPVWLRGSWQTKRRQDARCETHRLTSPLGSAYSGRHRLAVRARTTARRWSRTFVRVLDVG
jgi:hypothetical protein